MLKSNLFHSTNIKEFNQKWIKLKLLIRLGRNSIKQFKRMKTLSLWLLFNSLICLIKIIMKINSSELIKRSSWEFNSQMDGPCSSETSPKSSRASTSSKATSYQKLMKIMRRTRLSSVKIQIWKYIKINLESFILSLLMLSAFSRAKKIK